MKPVLLIRLAAAAIWFVFGAIFKILDLVPRHREIVAAVLGEEIAGPATVLVGVAELGLAVWVLIGFLPRFCAAAQTVALASMNLLELAFARDLLLAPIPMVCANVVFLSLVWWAAVRTAKSQGEAARHGGESS